MKTEKAISPTPAPKPKKQAKPVKKMFVVFDEADIRASWPNLHEACDVAEDAIERYDGRTMLVFELVATRKKK